MSVEIFVVSGPKFKFSLPNVGGSVVDNAVSCLSISLSLPEIFAIKCEVAHQISDGFCPPKF